MEAERGEVEEGWWRPGEKTEPQGLDSGAEARSA